MMDLRRGPPRGSHGHPFKRPFREKIAVTLIFAKCLFGLASTKYVGQIIVSDSALPCFSTHFFQFRPSLVCLDFLLGYVNQR